MPALSVSLKGELGQVSHLILLLEGFMYFHVVKLWKSVQ